jgi:hypothetical protein
MKSALALALLLACSACSQEDAPADEVVAAAEDIVDPAASPSPLAEGKWAPRDDCARIEGADQFRERLAAAIEQRDADALVALAADDIKLDFGGGGGTAELRTRLEDDSWDLWGELDELMALGCAANDQGGITIPWLFDQDIGEADPYASMLVTGENVPVYAGPDGDERRGAISWDLVEIASLDPEKPRQQVELPGGATGFIATDKLRSVIDYRLIASSRNGRWRITNLIAGD